MTYGLDARLRGNDGVGESTSGDLLGSTSRNKNVFPGLSENAEKGGGGSERKGKNDGRWTIDDGKNVYA